MTASSGQFVAREAQIVFRADASATIGAGHVRRCLTLAEEFSSEGWRVAFACRLGTCETVPLLSQRGYHVVELEPDVEDEAASLARAFPQGCSLAIFDHYDLDSQVEAACRGWASHIVAIDDGPTRTHDCDVLIDQTPGRVLDDYALCLPPVAVGLLGADYALLDRSFRDQRAVLRSGSAAIGRVFVSFGNSDVQGTTLKVLAALANTELEVDIAYGSPPPDIAEVRTMAARLRPQASIHIDPPHLAELMSRADIAVGSGGVMALERCCLGLPSLIVVMAENQQPNAQALVDRGAAKVVGTPRTLDIAGVHRELTMLVADAGRVSSMRQAAANVTDGLGARRVVQALTGLR